MDCINPFLLSFWDCFVSFWISQMMIWTPLLLKGSTNLWLGVQTCMNSLAMSSWCSRHIDCPPTTPSTLFISGLWFDRIDITPLLRCCVLMRCQNPNTCVTFKSINQHHIKFFAEFFVETSYWLSIIRQFCSFLCAVPDHKADHYSPMVFTVCQVIGFYECHYGFTGYSYQYFSCDTSRADKSAVQRRLSWSCSMNCSDSCILLVHE